MFVTPEGLLHSNYVVALLNDLFGIQARSGCFCAGPYLHRLYRTTSQDVERVSIRDCARARTGAKLAFFRGRVQLFHQRDRVFAYLVDAVHLVADEGWKLLPLYRFDPRRVSGSTRWAAPAAHEPARALVRPGPRRGRRAPSEPENALAGQLDEARRHPRRRCGTSPAAPDPVVAPEFERYDGSRSPGEALHPAENPC